MGNPGGIHNKNVLKGHKKRGLREEVANWEAWLFRDQSATSCLTVRKEIITPEYNSASNSVRL